METFPSIHQNSILGSLTTFDRMIFKGHMTMLYPNRAFARLLYRQGMLLKDFKPYLEEVSKQLKQHAEELAQQAGWSFRYLETAMTARKGQSKEELAKQITAEEHITEGLICVFCTL